MEKGAKNKRSNAHLYVKTVTEKLEDAKNANKEPI